MIIIDKKLCSIQIWLRNDNGYFAFDGVEEFTIDEFLSIAFVDIDGNIQCHNFCIDSVERYNVIYSKQVGVIGQVPREKS